MERPRIPRSRPLARIAALALMVALPLAATGAVVRTAPSFTFAAAGGTKSLASLRGQPVVLLVAKSAKAGPLRKQLKNLAAVFQDCASRGTIFVAAIAEGEATVPSNIPFTLASNAPAVAAAYGLRGEFLIAVIGVDGNMDLVTDKVQPGLRVLEVIKNNFEVQERTRREMPKGPPGR